MSECASRRWRMVRSAIADCPDRIAGLSVLDTTLSVGKPDGIVVEVANDRPNVLCWLFEDGAVIGLCHNAAPCLVPRQDQNGAACRLPRFVCCLIAVRPEPDDVPPKTNRSHLAEIGWRAYV